MVAALTRLITGPPIFPIDDISTRIDKIMGVKLESEIGPPTTMDFSLKLKKSIPEANQVKYKIGSLLELLGTSPSSVLRKPPSPFERLDVNVELSTVKLDKETYRLDLSLMKIFAAIVTSRGDWIASPQLQKLPGCRGKRIDRELKKLHNKLRELIESQSPKGYRLDLTKIKS